MKKNLDKISENRIISVIRNAREDNVINIINALYNGGVRTFEIAFGTTNTPRIIDLIRSEFKDEILLGAGTVLSLKDAVEAINVGVDFIFSPNINREVIEITKRNNCLSIPGAMTPSEILQGYNYGADAIKIFPSGALGASYLKDIQGPYPFIPLIPTGGINLENIKDYFEKGAIAVGLGNSLVNQFSINDIENLTIKAKQYIDIVK